MHCSRISFRNFYRSSSGDFFRNSFSDSLRTPLIIYIQNIAMDSCRKFFGESFGKSSEVLFKFPPGIPSEVSLKISSIISHRISLEYSVFFSLFERIFQGISVEVSREKPVEKSLEENFIRGWFSMKILEKTFEGFSEAFFTGFPSKIFD